MPDAFLDRRRFLKVNGYSFEAEDGSYADAYTRRGAHGNTWRGAPSRRERVRAREASGRVCIRSAEEADFLECLLSGVVHFAPLDEDAWFSTGIGPQPSSLYGITRRDFDPRKHHGIGFTTALTGGVVYDLGLPERWSAAWRQEVNAFPSTWAWRHQRNVGNAPSDRWEDSFPSVFTSPLTYDAATGALAIAEGARLSSLIVFPCWFPEDFVDHHYVWSTFDDLLSAIDFSSATPRDLLPDPTFTRFTKFDQAHGAPIPDVGPFRKVPALKFEGGSGLEAIDEDERWSLTEFNVLTIDLWVKVDSVPNGLGRILAHENVAQSVGWNLRAGSDGAGGWRPTFLMRSDAGDWFRTADVNLALGEWHHISLVPFRTGRDVFAWYINGAEYENTTSAPTTGTYLADNGAGVYLTIGNTLDAATAFPLRGSVAQPRFHVGNTGLFSHKSYGEIMAATGEPLDVVNVWPRSPQIIAEGYAIDGRRPGVFLPRLETQDYRQRGPRPSESGWQNNARDVGFSMVEIADARAHARRRSPTPLVAYQTSEKGERALRPGAPFLFFDARSITGIADGGQFITWDDESGNGRDLVAPGNLPFWLKDGGPENGPWVGLGGNNYYLDTAVFAAEVQPIVSLCVFKLDLLLATNAILNGTNAASNPNMSVLSTGAVLINGGASLQTAAGVVEAGAWCFSVQEYAGINSTIETNNGTTAGAANAGAESLTQLRVGANSIGTNDITGGVAMVGYWNDGTTPAEVVRYALAEFPRTRLL